MNLKSFTVSALILLLAIISVALLSARGNPTVVATNLDKLPMSIKGYAAVEDYFPMAVYENLNADLHVYRHYSKDSSRMIDLYIGYYGTAKGGRTGHNPNACLPGGGWGIIESKRTSINSRLYEKKVMVNYILAKKLNINAVILHWYQSSRNKVLSTGIEMNIQRFLSRVVYNRNDGAFIQISIYLEDNNFSEAKTIAKSFAGEILSLLPEYWPDEKDI